MEGPNLRRPVTEVPDSLPGVLGTAEEHGVGALGRPEGQLIKGDALATSRKDAGASSLGEPESAHYTTCGKWEEHSLHFKAPLYADFAPVQLCTGAYHAHQQRDVKRLKCA